MSGNATKVEHSAGIIRQHGAMEYSEPPVNLDQVRLYRLERLRQEMLRDDVAGLLLFDQINTRYATDATNMQVWCSHYETRCVFVALDGPVVLFDYANHPHLAEGLPGVDEYRPMTTFYFFAASYHSEARARVFADEIDDLMRTHGGVLQSIVCRSLEPMRFEIRGWCWPMERPSQRRQERSSRVVNYN